MKRRLDYIVRVHYTDFYFEDGEEALSFANKAALTVDEPAETIEIKVRYYPAYDPEEDNGIE